MASLSSFEAACSRRFCSESNLHKGAHARAKACVLLGQRVSVGGNKLWSWFLALSLLCNIVTETFLQDVQPYLSHFSGLPSLMSLACWRMFTFMQGLLCLGSASCIDAETLETIVDSTINRDIERAVCRSPFVGA